VACLVELLGTEVAEKVSTREEIIALQKAILRNIKRKISEHLGEIPPEVQTFVADYKRSVRRYRSVSTRSELLSEICQSDVVLCGDYHTLGQAQRTILRILRDLHDRAHPCVLGLELAPATTQRHINAFLQGKTNQEQLRKAIKYDRIWGFPWARYGEILEFARNASIPVVALNTSTGRGGAFPTLAQRDLFVAKHVTKALRAYPDRLLLVMFGDLHLAPMHLPRKIKARLKNDFPDKKRVLTVYQNRETIYWQLAEDKLCEKVDVVRIDDEAFCICGVPPWVKLQSYLDWLDGTNGEDLDDDEAPSSVVYEEVIFELATEIAQFLSVDNIELTDFVLYSCESEAFLDELEVLRSKEGPNVFDLVAANNCLFFPRDHMIYLATGDINHAAQAAAEFIHYQLSGYDTEDPTLKDGFYRRILRKALGYFGSMLINHKRKCWYFRDHHIFVERLARCKLDAPERQQRSISRMVLRHQSREDAFLAGTSNRLHLPSIYQGDLDCAYAISRALGYIMGDKLFKGLLQKVVSREEIRELFANPLTGTGTAQRVYLDWRLLLKHVVKIFTSKDQFF